MSLHQILYIRERRSARAFSVMNSANIPYGLQVFFYKAHIFAGQARPAEKSISDFAWLTKEEIEPYVDKEYWLGTRDMLSDF